MSAGRLPTTVLAIIVILAGLVWYSHDEGDVPLQHPKSSQESRPAFDALAPGERASGHVSRSSLPSSVTTRLVSLPEVPARRFALLITEQIRRAESGDPEAALVAYLMISECRHHPRSIIALEEALAAAQRTPLPGIRERRSRALVQGYERCEGFPESLVAGAEQPERRFLEQAASAGLPAARRQYLKAHSQLSARHAAGADSDASPEAVAEVLGRMKAFVTEDSERGGVYAFEAMAQWHLDGSLGFPADQSRALGYLLAFQAATRGQGSDIELVERATHLEGVTARLISTLRPAEVEQAQTLARGLLSRAGCCWIAQERLGSG